MSQVTVKAEPGSAGSLEIEPCSPKSNLQVKKEEESETIDPNDYSFSQIELSNVPDVKSSCESLKDLQYNKDELDESQLDLGKGNISKSSTKPKSGYCIYCEKEYKHLRSHVLFIHCNKTKGGLTCDQCSAVCKDRKKFVQHYLTKHNKQVSGKKRLPRKEKTKKMYKCPDCPMTFDNSHALCGHRKIHRKVTKLQSRKKFTCDLCCTSYEVKSSLLRHVQRSHRAHSGEKSGPSRCTFCFQVYSTSRELKLHVKLCTSQRNTVQTPPCEICSKSFGKMWQLENHKRSHPLCEWNVSCKKCKLGFMNCEDLKEHKKLKECNIDEICEICTKTFLTKANLKRHIKEVHKEGNSASELHRFSCSMCTKEFSQKGHLNRHMVLHSNNPKPHQCEQCKKSFSESHQLKRHMLIHTGNFPAKCMECECAFRTFYELNIHRVVHTSASEAKQFKCKFCDRQFPLKSRLDGHERVHTNNRPFKCDICNESFRHLASLHRHKMRHKNTKYKCDQCPKTFLDYYVLHYHRTHTHSSMKLFACDKCGKCYKELDTLTKLHQQMNHTKPHNCKFCCNTFKTKISLKKHIVENHNKLRPYFCPECLAKFTKHTSMIGHVRTMHLKAQNIKLWRCHHQGCNGTYIRMHSLERHLCTEHGSLSRIPKPNNFDIHATRVIMNNKTDSPKSKKFNTATGIHQMETQNVPSVSETSHLDAFSELSSGQWKNADVKFKESTKEHSPVKLGNSDEHNLETKVKNSPILFEISTCKSLGSRVAASASQPNDRDEDVANTRNNLVCNKCHIQFCSSELLLIHMFVHTGAKPFGCDICDKAFATNFALNKHKSIKH